MTRIPAPAVAARDEDWNVISYGGHVLGGWPRVIQNPMELECELVTNGINTDDPEGYADPCVVELRKRAGDWRLLLQLDSSDDLDWMWGISEDCTSGDGRATYRRVGLSAVGPSFNARESAPCGRRYFAAFNPGYAPCAKRDQSVCRSVP